MRRLLPFIVLLLPLSARADFTHPAPGEVAVRDVPGTNRHWQEARTLVDAEPEAVRRWMTEVEYWPARFKDVKEAHVLERSGNRIRVKVKSEIMHELTFNVHITETGMFYEVDDPHVKAAGRLFITPAGDGQSDVIMQTSANVTGFIGMLAPKSMIRDRERDKLTSDLSDLNRLAHSHHGDRSARRPPPARHAQTP